MNHWLEEWRRARCELIRKPACIDCMEKCPPTIALAEAGGIPVGMINRIIFEDLITHPKIAAGIADAADATVEQFNTLVHEKHWGKWEPGAKPKKRKPREETKLEAPARADERMRPVVMIDRNGMELQRFPSCTAAVNGTGCNERYIRNRCNRNLRGKTDEFANLKASFRWADEWEAMSEAERQETIYGGARAARLYEWRGEKHTIAEWARIANLQETTLRYRLKSGWDIDKAMKTQIRGYTAAQLAKEENRT